MDPISFIAATSALASTAFSAIAAKFTWEAREEEKRKQEEIARIKIIIQELLFCITGMNILADISVKEERKRKWFWSPKPYMSGHKCRDLSFYIHGFLYSEVKRYASDRGLSFEAFEDFVDEYYGIASLNASQMLYEVNDKEFVDHVQQLSSRHLTRFLRFRPRQS